MNLLLIEREELLGDDCAVIDVARYPARAGLWPPRPGRQLRAGLSGGCIGEAIVERVADAGVYLRFKCEQAPPAAMPLSLVLAMPRPKMLRRMLRSIAELGIKELYLVNSSRVEKSYWQSPLLEPSALHGYLVAGLEQVCDTMLPKVHLRTRLRPFVEDELPSVAAASTRLVAHPDAGSVACAAGSSSVTLAIGPEGGFTDFEIELLGSAGFRAITLGPRILRVETALPVLAATLFPAQ